MLYLQIMRKLSLAHSLKQLIFSIYNHNVNFNEQLMLILKMVFQNLNPTNSHPETGVLK